MTEIPVQTAPEDISRQSPPLAVIDIGSTSLRMLIAHVKADGTMQKLDFLHQNVPLGKDTFVKGSISQSTIEKTIQTVKSFQKIMLEYGIEDERQIRVVATTAVREAINSDAFIDRIAVSTGLKVEIIDDIDIARLTYLSFRARLKEHEFLAKDDVVICEVSGGSSFLLFIRDSDVHFAQSYQLGTLRTYEMIESAGAPGKYLASMTRSHIKRTVENIITTSGLQKTDYMVALGYDTRFAASHLLGKEEISGTVEVSVGKLERFTETIMSMSVDDCMRTYNLSYADAETIGTGLLSYVYLAKALKLKKIIVADISMRHGLMLELYGKGWWTAHLKDQTIRSVLEIGRKYQFDEDHAEHVARLSAYIFGVLKQQHKLAEHAETILTVAAYLHDIGLFINSRKHHRHSLYLIQNSPIFGVNKQDLLLASMVARYHRHSGPKPSHLDFMQLDYRDRILVTKLAAILRVADALDRNNSQQIGDISCTCSQDKFIIEASTGADIMLEQIALREKGSLFTEVYGMQVVLQKVQKDVR